MATRDDLKARIRAAASRSLEGQPSSREILMQRIAATRVPPIPEPQSIAPPEEFGPERTARGVAQLAMALGEGGTAGFAPEIVAAGKTAAGALGVPGQSSSFTENLGEVEEVVSRIPEGTRMMGNLLGAAAAGAGMPAAMAPTTLKGAAAMGAGAGGLAGAGFAEGDLIERGKGAALGAGTGALAGAAGQGLIQGLGRVISRMRQGVDRPTARALDRVLSDLKDGNISPQQAINRVQRLGPEGMLADVPELQRLAQSTASSTTTGQRIAQSALDRRRFGAPQRVQDVLDRAFGGRNTREVRRALVASQRANAEQLYEPALSGGLLQRTPALTDLIGEVTEEGIKGGSRDVRRAMTAIRQSNPRFRDLPDEDPNLLHAVRKALADRSTGQGEMKRNLNDIVQQLTDAMDEAGATGYRQAVDQYRSDAKTLKAFDKGRKALNMLPEETEAFLTSVPQGEKEAFVAGLGRQVLREMDAGETGNAAQNVRKILRGERAEILRDALGDEGYDAFRNRLMREIRFAQTTQKAVGGSPTQPRQATAREQLEKAGRFTRAVESLREGRGYTAAGIEAARAALPAGSREAQEKALAQLLFRSQGQGLGPGRFGPGQTPLTELALRESLKRGASRLLAPARGPAAAGGGLAAGSIAGGVEF